MSKHGIAVTSGAYPKQISNELNFYATTLHPDKDTFQMLTRNFGDSHLKWRCYMGVCMFYCMMTSSNGTFSALLAICAGNSPVTGEFPTQRPVTRSFDIFFDLRLNRRLSKQSWGWWFALSRPLWRHGNGQSFFNGLSICLPGVLNFTSSLIYLAWIRVDASRTGAVYNTSVSDYVTMGLAVFDMILGAIGRS